MSISGDPERRLRVTPGGDMRLAQRRSATMAHYVLLCVGGTHPSDRDEEARVLQAWGDWFARLGSAVVDQGSPFGPRLTISPGGTSTKGAASGLTGYAIFSAERLEVATEIARGCPHLGSFGTT